MRRLVVTGDDFGASAAVNRAIVEAHDRGILTSASLMVTGAAAGEAVSLARARPRLAVGLHLVVIDGRPALSPGEVPRLADAAGRFRENPFTAGLVYQFSRPARRQLEAEIRAQLRLFRETGLPLSHVDGHHHMHLHPVVLETLVALAEEFDIRWIRVPRGEIALALEAERRGAAGKIFWSAVFGLLQRRATDRLRSAGIGFPDRVYGLLMTGRVGERYVLEVLRDAPDGVAELYCHPVRALPDAAPGPEADRGARELAALTSGPVRQAASAGRVVLTNFLAIDRAAELLPARRERR